MREPNIMAMNCVIKLIGPFCVMSNENYLIGMAALESKNAPETSKRPLSQFQTVELLGYQNELNQSV